MPDTMWDSDWEILFAKCAEDKDYRNALAAALEAKDRSKVVELLEGIGVAGTGHERNRRVEALLDAQGAMTGAAGAFGSGMIAG